MKLRFALVVLFPASLILTAQAQDVPEVPSALFDIELGGVYEYRSDGADENSPGTFPVRRLVSEQLSVHRGISLYFEPLTANSAFPFRELEVTSVLGQTIQLSFTDEITDRTDEEIHARIRRLELQERREMIKRRLARPVR